MKRSRVIIDPDTKVLLKQIGIGLGVIFSVGLVVAAVWYSTRLASLTLVEVSVSGGETVDLSEIEQVTQSALEGAYAGIIPRRFAWFYPKGDVLAKINTIPRVYDIEVQRDGGTRLIVTFNEYSPAGLWCQSTAGTDCVFINNKAYAFDQAPQLSGDSLVRFVRLGEQTKIGESMLESEQYTALWALIDLLTQRSLYVSHIEFDQVGDAFIGLVGGGELKILISAEPEQTINNLDAILQSPDFKHLEPGNFQYIDLRFGEKVFVKEALIAPEIELETASSSSVSDADQTQSVGQQ